MFIVQQIFFIEALKYVVLFYKFFVWCRANKKKLYLAYKRRRALAYDLMGGCSKGVQFVSERSKTSSSRDVHPSTEGLLTRTNRGMSQTSSSGKNSSPLATDILESVEGRYGMDFFKCTRIHFKGRYIQQTVIGIYPYI